MTTKEMKDAIQRLQECKQSIYMNVGHAIREDEGHSILSTNSAPIEDVVRLILEHFELKVAKGHTKYQLEPKSGRG